MTTKTGLRAVAASAVVLMGVEAASAHPPYMRMSVSNDKINLSYDIDDAFPPDILLPVSMVNPSSALTVMSRTFDTQSGSGLLFDDSPAFFPTINNDGRSYSIGVWGPLLYWDTAAANPSWGHVPNGEFIRVAELTGATIGIITDNPLYPTLNVNPPSTPPVGKIIPNSLSSLNTSPGNVVGIANGGGFEFHKNWSLRHDIAAGTIGLVGGSFGAYAIGLQIHATGTTANPTDVPESSDPYFLVFRAMDITTDGYDENDEDATSVAKWQAAINGLTSVLAAQHGFFQDDAIVTVPTGSGEFIFDNAPNGRWYDPPTSNEYEYTMIGDSLVNGSLFTKIQAFPTGIDGDNTFHVLVNGMDLGEFGTGVNQSSVDFVSLLGHGVSSFKITGIDPLPNAMDFPIQLAFNTGIADFKVVPGVIPEPASAVMLICLGGFGVLRRKR